MGWNVKLDKRKFTEMRALSLDIRLNTLARTPGGRAENRF